MRQLFLCFLFLLPAAAFGQPYQPLAADTLRALQTVEEKRRLWLGRLPGSSSEWLEQAYASRYDYLRMAVRGGHLLYGSAVQPFLDSIVAEICRANPDIPAADIFVLPSRYAEPNAASLGDGTILVNAGLLRRLENESQLAFILCHEIAHYTLGHLEASVEQYAAAADDEDFRKELKRLGKQGNKTEALGLLGKVVYEYRRNSREQEAQADARGLAYFANTAYDARQAARCLELLDNIDQEKYPGTLDVGAALNTKGYPFKSRWLEEESSMFGGRMGQLEEGPFHADSLRTHPACRERMARLEGLAVRHGPDTGAVFLQDSRRFRQWVEAADYEVIEGLYAFGATAEALYHCLVLLAYHPEDPYLNTMAGRCLLRVHAAMGAHSLEDHVPLPGASLRPGYRQLCQVLHNLRMREAAALAYHFLKEREGRFAAYAPFRQALEQSRELYEK